MKKIGKTILVVITTVILIPFLITGLVAQLVVRGYNEWDAVLPKSGE